MDPIEIVPLVAGRGWWTRRPGASCILRPRSLALCGLLLGGCRPAAELSPRPPLLEPATSTNASSPASTPSPAPEPQEADAYETRAVALVQRVDSHDAELTLQAVDALSRRRMLLVDYHPEHPRVLDVTSRLEVLLTEAERSVPLDDSARRVAEGLTWLASRLREEQAEARSRYGPAHPHMQRLTVQIALLDRLLPLVPTTDVERLDVVDLWVSRDEVAGVLADAERRFAAGHEQVSRLRADVEALEQALDGRRPVQGDCATLRRSYDLRLAHLRGQREASPVEPAHELDVRIDGLVVGRARTLAGLSCAPNPLATR